MLFILCTLLLALKRLWQALESWHLKVGDRFFWVLLHELFAFNWKMMNKKSTKDVKSCGRHPTKKKKKINNKATNKHKQDNRTTYVYKKWLPPIIPRSDTFLSEVHSYHTFCTHIYNPNVHFTSKINIFTQKRKTIWINNFIDKKKQALQNSNIVKETRHSRLQTVLVGAAICSAHTLLWIQFKCSSFTY